MKNHWFYVISTYLENMTNHPWGSWQQVKWQWLHFDSICTTQRVIMINLTDGADVSLHILLQLQQMQHYFLLWPFLPSFLSKEGSFHIKHSIRFELNPVIFWIFDLFNCRRQDLIKASNSQLLYYCAELKDSCWG